MGAQYHRRAHLHKRDSLGIIKLVRVYGHRARRHSLAKSNIGRNLGLEELRAVKKRHTRDGRCGFDASREHAHLYAMLSKHGGARHCMSCDAAVPDPLRCHEQYRRDVHRQPVRSQRPRLIAPVRTPALIIEW
jgi:hypothetical protein